MKKLTAEEAAAIATKPLGSVSIIRTALVNMKPGEFLHVERSDWKWKKGTPGIMCRRLERHSSMRFDCKRVVVGTGWIIKREK